MFDRRYEFPESIRSLLIHPTTAIIMSWSALLLDLVVFPSLLWKKTRLFAMIAAVTFHLLNTQLFLIDIFPWFMLAASFAFFFPDKLPFRDRRAAHFGTEHHGDGMAQPMTKANRRVAVFVGIYLAVQVLIPLRPFFYPGNTSWSNEGQHFSWRMLVRSKEIDLDDPPLFIARARKDGEVMEGPIAIDRTDPRFHRIAWAQHWQLRKVPRNPDLILQFAHRQRERLRAEGLEDIEIRAWIPISLNGRIPQPIVDPSVDLANEQRRFLTPYPWVTPLKSPLSSFEIRRARDEIKQNKVRLWLEQFHEAAGSQSPPADTDADVFD